MAFNEQTNKLELMLGQLVQSMGISVQEYMQGGFLDLTTYGTEHAAIIARLNAIDVVDGADNVETLAEKIIAINTVLSNDAGELQGILDLITANTTATTALSNLANVRHDAMITAQGIQDGAITSNANAAAVNAAAITALADATGLDITALENRVTITESLLATLRADDTVVGSVANSVLTEQNRAKAVSGILANLSTTDKTNLVAAINEIVAANATTQAANDTALAAEANTRLANDNALQAGIDALQVLATAATDALQAEITDRTAADAALGLRVDAAETATADEAARAATAEAALQANIDAIGGSGSGSLGDLELRVDAQELETTTTDAAARLSALELGATNEEAARIAGDAGLDTRLAALEADTTTATALTDEEAARVAADAALSARTTALENELNDGTDAQDNLVKGIKTRVTDLEGAVAQNAIDAANGLAAGIADAKAHSDAQDIHADTIDVCAVGNIFRTALGLAENTCTGEAPAGGAGDGAVL